MHPSPTVPNGHSAPTPSPNQPQRSRSLAREMPPALEPNFDNVVPYDDLTRTAADLIWETVMGFPVELGPGDHFEIEAKLGTIIALGTGDRIALPVDSECAISLDFAPRIKFQSSMTTEQHQHLNKYLNNEVQRSTRPNRVPIKYQHLYETDTFYEINNSDIAYLSPAAQHASKQKPNRSPRVRVSTNTKTGQQLAKIVKFRLEDRNYYCPKQNFDFRISVSLECDVEFDVAALTPSEEGPRIKDRLSYRHQAMCMDLTQVKTLKSKVHELEVELDAEEIRREALRAQSQQENQFEPLVTVFLNYIRALSRVDVVPRPL